MIIDFCGKILEHDIILRDNLDLRTLPLFFSGYSFEVSDEVLSFVVSSLGLFI
jgi:hypothetical protein